MTEDMLLSFIERLYGKKGNDRIKSFAQSAFFFIVISFAIMKPKTKKKSKTLQTIYKRLAGSSQQLRSQLLRACLMDTMQLLVVSHLS